MSTIVILGNERFALELASYLRDIEPTARLTHLALEDLLDSDVQLSGSHRYVLGISDISRRQSLIDRYFSDGRLAAPNFVHPSVRHQLDLSASRGNVIAADSYLGVNVRLGSWNMINYHCCIGHHSTLGDNNFVSPNFNAGNSVAIGSRCFFGLSTVVVPQTEIGDDVTAQAGVTLSEQIPERSHCSSSARQKIIQLVEGSHNA